MKLADVIDSGTFSIYIGQNGNYRWYGGKVVVGSTNLDLLRRCVEVSGYGKVIQRKARVDLGNRKTYYYWNLIGQDDVVPVLGRVIDKLTKKREHAIMMMAFFRSDKGRRIGVSGLDFKLAMHALNRRGAVPTTDERLALHSVKNAIATAYYS